MCNPFLGVFMKYLLIVFLFLSSVAYSTFLPENDLYLEDSSVFSNISEKEFDEMIYEFWDAYRQLYGDMGLDLRVLGHWNDSTVNAYTYVRGRTVYIEIFGGLARRPEITDDGFTSVLCHEAGHTLGGFPFYPGERMASEGQADYYTTHGCHKKLWDYSNVTRDQDYGMELDSEAKKLCSNSSDRDLCYRSLSASLSLARLLAAGRTNVSYATPDKTVVQRTQTSHPNAQCRLDTYRAGALCEKRWDDTVIPSDESESYEYVCEYGIAARPRCWFAPGN